MINNRFMSYGPVICIAVVLLVLFIVWAFWGGQNYEFIGLDPLNPNKIGEQKWEWENDQICYEHEIQSIIDNNQIDQSRNNNNQIDESQNNDIEELQICRDEPKKTIIKPPKIKVPKDKIRNSRNRMISKGERICCMTMEKIYGVEFKSHWPNWLVNPETGRKMELDCYNEELKIAVEYQGIQHYEFPNYIKNQTYQEFINQVRRDELKVRLCDENGVYLIVVPYKISHEDIPAYITSRLPETIKNRIEHEASS